MANTFESLSILREVLGDGRGRQRIFRGTACSVGVHSRVSETCRVLGKEALIRDLARMLVRKGSLVELVLLSCWTVRGILVRDKRWRTGWSHDCLVHLICCEALRHEIVGRGSRSWELRRAIVFAESRVGKCDRWRLSFVRVVHLAISLGELKASSRERLAFSFVRTSQQIICFNFMTDKLRACGRKASVVP